MAPKWLDLPDNPIADWTAAEKSQCNKHVATVKN